MSILPETTSNQSGSSDVDARSLAVGATPGPAARVFTRVDTDPAPSPPSSNTGAQNTEDNDNLPLQAVPSFRASVDYLAFTWPVAVPVAEVISCLDGPEPLDWRPTDRGANGYSQGLACGDIRIFYDGRLNKEGEADMGVFVSMKGAGCDQYASACRWTSEDDWRPFVGKLLAANCSITRFDLAYDDLEQHVLYMEKVRTKIDEGCVVSTWKDCDPSGRRSLSEGAERKGDVIHFGSIKSDVSGCMYDKAKEQLARGFQHLAGIHWVRCELRTKQEKATAMASAFVAEGFKAGVAVLRGYLDFKERSETDSNRSRWATCDWWDKFCAGAEKASLKLDEVKRTVDKTLAWLINQAAPSLALVVDAYDTSKDKMGGLALLASLVGEGRKRFRKVHENMLAEFWGCPTVETSDGGRLYQWPDEQWRYVAPPSSVPA